METLELPVAESTRENSPWSDPPPFRFEEQPIDLVAFALWRDASLADTGTEEEPGS